MNGNITQTQKTIYDEIENQLAIPLGMQVWNRSLLIKEADDPTKLRYWAHPMWFSTRDMAKIGQLMLQKDKWNGKQIISKAWLNEMIKQRTNYKEVHKNFPVLKEKGVNFGYGYMWWLFEDMKDNKFKDAYAAPKKMGQIIAVFPAMNVVLAYKTKRAYGRENSILVRMDILKKIVNLFNPN
ncbi:serine hydrolase domain-containing protein [Flavisericum labens]|uniref:hypothetical protein n=1 Tax=Flavisericum labens TaxID=3377112 RepID=UPI00387B2D2F